MDTHQLEYQWTRQSSNRWAWLLQPWELYFVQLFSSWQYIGNIFNETRASILISLAASRYCCDLPTAPHTLTHSPLLEPPTHWQPALYCASFMWGAHDEWAVSVMQWGSQRVMWKRKIVLYWEQNQQKSCSKTKSLSDETECHQQLTLPIDSIPGTSCFHLAGSQALLSIQGVPNRANACGIHRGKFE